MSRSRHDVSEAALEAVFLLAGGEERRAQLRDRARAAVAGADFHQLALGLQRRRLLPLIGSRVLEAAGDLCPPEFAATVEAARREARARGLSVEAATRQAAERLGEAGIRALPLKGPLLAEEAHGDVGLRDTSDVDLLVPRERLAEAAELLAGEPFGEPQDPLRGNGLPDLHLALRSQRRPSIEIHWRVHWYEEAFSADMLARARPGPDGLLRAVPDDLLASLLLYYARDGFHGVRLAADIAAWWDRHGHALPPRPLEGHARRYPELRPALTASAAVIEGVTGIAATEWLGSCAVRGRRVELAERLADWRQAGDRDQVAANMSLVDGLLGPSGAGRAFVRRELLPPSGSPVTHAAKVGARCAIALWRVRRGRLWAPPPMAA
ncbi:MAG TPA: nucleotidyltransferase family protein [Thermoleophilaceae bacterium]